MVRARRGFTLAELLVVIVVIAIVAAITFPVMQSAKASAIKTSCASQFRQAQIATTLYLNDYDDHFMLVNYQIGAPNPAERDRTWVQLLLPYLQTFDIFRCPADARNRESSTTIDVDLVPGDTYARYYDASLKSNIGYNYLYLCPASKIGNNYVIQPRTMSMIGDPGQTLLFADSVGHRGREASGNGGGGSYIIAPPCRFSDGPEGDEDSFMLNPNAAPYAPTKGWSPTHPNEYDRFGRVWPWHTKRANIAKVGGGVTSVTVEQLSGGCETRSAWTGKIHDSAGYFWDLQ